MYDTETEVAMPWKYNDGGYAKSGFRAKRGNNVVIALAIATDQIYREVYNQIYDRQVDFVAKSRSSRVKDKGPYIPEVGVWPQVSKKYLLDLGWTWTPIMGIGTGTTVHLTYEEVPDEPLVVCSISRSLVTVVHGVVQATSDPSRDGSRAIYGYWVPGS